MLARPQEHPHTLQFCATFWLGPFCGPPFVGKPSHVHHCVLRHLRQHAGASKLRVLSGGWFPMGVCFWGWTPCPEVNTVLWLDPPKQNGEKSGFPTHVPIFPYISLDFPTCPYISNVGELPFWSTTIPHTAPCVSKRTLSIWMECLSSSTVETPNGEILQGARNLPRGSFPPPVVGFLTPRKAWEYSQASTVS